MRMRTNKLFVSLTTVSPAATSKLWALFPVKNTTSWPSHTRITSLFGPSRVPRSKDCRFSYIVSKGSHYRSLKRVNLLPCHAFTRSVDHLCKDSMRSCILFVKSPGKLWRMQCFINFKIEMMSLLG